jgi:hypothetical protein
MKEFDVNISFSGRLNITVNAESKDEVVDKIYEALGFLEIKSSDKDVMIESEEWDLIKEAPQGNIATPFVSDVEIEEIE